MQDIHQQKAKYLPITREEYGYVQKTQYHQPDLYHEEVIELDSPYASIVQAGTQVFSFLLLGDQNAGKSTFLHSFTYHFDTNFLAITSILPILTSSFINTRFYFEKEMQKEEYAKIFPNMTPFKPMDEIPFIDTDIARGTFLITKEDFLFFLDEYHIPPPPELQRDTVYVVVQFVEIGGDHLDSLMHYLQNPSVSLAPSLVDILKRSLDLLLQARKTIYFINCTSLFSVIPDTQELVVNENAIHALVRRLRFLNSTFKHTHQMLFYLSRTPTSAVFSPTSATKSLQTINHILHTSLPPPPPTPLSLPPPPSPSTSASPSVPPSTASLSTCAFLSHIFQTISELEGWTNLRIVDVMPASHINELDGSLNADEVVNTLVRCCQTQMVDSHISPDLAVVKQILDCYKKEVLEEFLEHSPTPDFYPIYWISKIVFRDYLLEEDDVEIPHPVLIQKFGPVAQKMVRAGVLVRYARSNHSDICLVLNTEDGNKYVWHPPQDSQETAQKGDADMVVRFPHFVPLFKFVESNFITNPPANFWTQESALDISQYQNASSQLHVICTQLEEIIYDRFLKIQQNINSDDILQYIDTLFWLLEDWAMGTGILQNHQKNLAQKFAQKLQISPQFLQILREKKFLVSENSARAGTMVEIDILCK